MSKAKRFRKIERGTSITIQIWSPLDKRYTRSKTFNAKNYPKARERERAALRWAEAEADQFNALESDVHASGKQLATDRMLEMYYQHLEKQEANPVHLANTKSKLMTLPDYLLHLDQADAEQACHRWWQAWCAEPYRRWHGRGDAGKIITQTNDDGQLRSKSNSTKNTGLKNLLSFVNWCWKYRKITGMTRKLDLSWIQKFRVTKKIKPIFTIQELRTGLLTEHAYAIRWALYVFTGLRSTEGLALRWDDINYENGAITAREVKKGAMVAKERIVPLQKELIPYLRRHHEQQKADYKKKKIKPDGFVFSAKERRGDAVKRFNRFLEAAGIDKKERTTHSLRHGYAAMMTATGLNPILLEQHMGHEPGDMTRHYAQLATLFRHDVASWTAGELRILNYQIDDPVINDRWLPSAPVNDRHFS